MTTVPVFPILFVDIVGSALVLLLGWAAFISSRKLLAHDPENALFQGKLEVLPNTYSQENYGIALVNNSPLRKSINQVLLQTIRSQEWQETLYRYLGR